MKWKRRELAFDRPSTLVRGRARGGHKRDTEHRDCWLSRREGEERSFPPAMPAPVEIMQSRIAHSACLSYCSDKKQANTMLFSVWRCWNWMVPAQTVSVYQVICSQPAPLARVSRFASVVVVAAVIWVTRSTFQSFSDCCAATEESHSGWGLMARCCPRSTICGSKFWQGSTIISN